VLVRRLDARADLVDNLLHCHRPFVLAPDLADGVSLGHRSRPAGLLLLGLLCLGRRRMLCGRQHQQPCHQGNTELLHLEFSSASTPVPPLWASSKGEHGPWAVLSSLLALPAWFRQSTKPRSASSAHRYAPGFPAALRLQPWDRRRPARPLP